MHEILTVGITVPVPGSDFGSVSPYMYGFRNPYEPHQRARLIAESPSYNADKITTPTLLEFGAHSAAIEIGRPFFAALRWNKVPSAFFVYDEGHVFYRPAAIADDLTRTAEWLDHWVRGMPYPDSGRAAEYDSGKK